MTTVLKPPVLSDTVAAQNRKYTRENADDMSDVFQKHMEYIIEKFDGASAPMMDEDTREDLALL